MKKHISILFLMIANALLLAHSFVPHHHHREQICLEQDHCNDVGHDHMVQDHTCHHGSTDAETCLVRAVYAIPADKTGQPNYSCFQVIWGFDVENHVSLMQMVANNRLIPYVPDTYAFIASGSYGMRAPPMV